MQKVLRRFGIVLAALVVVGATALLVVTRDEAPPHITDLTPRPRTLPPEKNAYIALLTLAEEFKALPQDDAYMKALEHLDDGNAWAVEDAQLVVRQAVALWPRFDQAVALSQGEAPIPTSMADFIPTLSDVRGLWVSSLVRARLTAHTLNSEEGLALGLRSLNGTHAFSSSGGPVLTQLTGIVLRGIALERIRGIIDQTSPSPSAMRACIVTLEQSRQPAETFAEAFRAEHRSSELMIRMLSKLPRTWSTVMDAPRGMGWFFKPHKTARLLAERTRHLIALIDQPAQAHPMPEKFTPCSSVLGNLAHPDNALGRYYLQLSTGSYTGILTARLRDQIHISVTQAWIALRLFEKQTGDLPESLDLLVPAYLPVVPRDYFTGDAVRYSRDVRAVWSAGETNLVVTHPDQEIPKHGLVLRLKP